MSFYNWSEFLTSHFRKIPNIKRNHHYTISSDSPGSVTIKEYNDSEGVTFKMLKDDWSPSAMDLPPVIPPPGLSSERQWYLYDNIREYCPPSCRDIVCPKPSVAKPGHTSGAQSSEPPPANEVFRSVSDQQSSDTQQPVLPPPTTTLAPPAKRPKVCGVCGESGHNARRHK